MCEYKIKPFYVELKDISYEQLEEIYQMCIEAGAVVYESISELMYDGYYYFGIDCHNETMFYNDHKCYSGVGGTAIKLTYDQVTDHLGFTTDSIEGYTAVEETFVEGVINGFPFKVPEDKWEDFSKTVVFTTKFLVKDEPVSVEEDTVEGGVYLP